MPNISEQNPIRIRLPDALKERLQAAATAGHRSLNSEVVKRLEESFIGPDAQIEEAIERILEQRGLVSQLELPTKDASVESLAVLADRLRAGIARLKTKPKQRK